MIIALVLLYFGFNYLKGIDFFSSNHRYYAVYDNVDKLTMSNQIFINGYAVGRVSDIAIMQNNGNKVLVEMEISSDIVLGESTTAILTGDFLGNKSITLDIGAVRNPLSPGDTVRSMLDRGIADILTETAAPVADNLQVTLRKFNTLMDNLTRNTQRLDTIFMGLERTPIILNRSLNAAHSNIDDLSISFKQVAENLNAVLKGMQPVVANFKTVSDSLKMLQLNGTLLQLNQTLAKVNESLGRLSKGDNTVSKLMTDDEMYNNLNRLLLNLDTLANHFNNNPKHFMAPLGMSRKKIEKELRKQDKENGK